MKKINNLEFRIKDCQLQTDDSGVMKIGGYINVTERESEMLFNKRNGKWFREVMKQGVFQRAIDKANGIPLLYEHNWDKKLASTFNGSLSLIEDNIGLRFDAVIDDENVYEEIKAGIINSCSFGFRALQEKIEPINSKFEKRFVNAIELLEVSIVKNPAYVGSLCESRSYEEELEKEQAQLEEIQDNSSDEERDNPSETEVETIEDNNPDEERTQEESTEPIEEPDTENDSEEEDKRSGESQLSVIDVGVLTSETEVATDIETLKKYIDDLINERFNAVSKAEEKERQAMAELEEVKRVNEDYEREAEEACMRQSAEVVNLRLQLMKLKEIKRGI